jgi:O-antigen ligase
MFNYFIKFKKFTFYEWILFLFPFSLILGSAYVNIFLFLASFFFIYEIINKKLFHKINIPWVNFYIIFIFYNFYRGFFANDFIMAMQSSFSQLRFLFFALFIYMFIKNKENIKFMMVGWLILLLFISFNSLYSLFFLKDIFGYPVTPGYPENTIRFSLPFDKKLVVGTFILYISVPIIAYFFSKLYKLTFLNKILFVLIYSLLFLIVSLSGERLALFAFLSASFLILIFFLDFKKKIIFSILIFLMFLGTYLKTDQLRLRVNDSIYILTNFYDSSYGRLYESSYLLFKKNYFFGVGFKNYRVVCDKQIDPRPESIFQFCSTHPHNFYLEILVEAGLVGFLIFGISFFYLFSYILKEIKNNKVDFKKYFPIIFGNLLIIAIYIWPIKTSGSFFTTWNGSFFWLSLGILLLMLRKKDF